MEGVTPTDTGTGVDVRTGRGELGRTSAVRPPSPDVPSPERPPQTCGVECGARGRRSPFGSPINQRSFHESGPSSNFGGPEEIPLCTPEIAPHVPTLFPDRSEFFGDVTRPRPPQGDRERQRPASCGLTHSRTHRSHRPRGRRGVLRRLGRNPTPLPRHSGPPLGPPLGTESRTPGRTPHTSEESPRGP